MDIQFTKTTLLLPTLDTSKILKIITPHGHATDVLCIDQSHTLWRINIITAECQLIDCDISHLALSTKTPIQIQISPCCNYLAITRINYDESNNYGVVINLTNGKTIFELKDCEYHSEQADFPVTFFLLNNCCHLIYASEWNNLDIINLETGKCLTARTNEEITQAQREDALFTEWAGELKISPDGKRIATIGWMWHPIGIAWNFSLENWINDKWEADFGKSKTQMGCVWDYFWHSPFAWLGNERIIIWGDPETQNNHDIPADNAVIYNANTGEKLSSFDGPTIDIFETDGPFLFSGNTTRDGLSVWLWETGTQITEIPFKNRLMTYHPQQSTFITLNTDNQIELIKWQMNNDPSLTSTL